MNKTNATKIVRKKINEDCESTLLSYGERLERWDFLMGVLCRNGKITNTQLRRWING